MGRSDLREVTADLKIEQMMFGSRREFYPCSETTQYDARPSAVLVAFKDAAHSTWCHLSDGIAG